MTRSPSPRPRSEGTPGRRARRAAVALGAALLLLIAFTSRSSQRRPREPSTAEERSAAEPVSFARSRPSTVPSAGPKPSSPAPHPTDPPPVIDEIRVEKSEVCSGEENLVTVRAHTVNGTDEFLHYVIDGSMGSSVPLRLWLGSDGRVEGQHDIRVLGRTNSAVTVPLPEYTVRDCQPRRVVALDARLRANTWSEFDFVARVVELPSPSNAPRSPAAPDAFRPVAYTWSFGDGTGATTAAPTATHDYEARRQESLYSYFTAAVEVRAQDGQTLLGRTTLPLINPAFESFAQKGIVQLLVALDPRFPEVGSDGRVVQRVRLWHIRPDPVTIESAVMVKYLETGAGGLPPSAVDPAQLLGTTTVPPGPSGVTTSVVLDTVTDPGVFSVTYRLQGRSHDGHPVLGSFSVMLPPAHPRPDNSELVLDPALKAKILAAREMLGQDVVHDEDLWRLERAGRFSGLVVPAQEGAPGPATRAAPPAMPDRARPLYGPPVPTGITPPPTATTAPGGPPAAK